MMCSRTHIVPVGKWDESAARSPRIGQFFVTSTLIPGREEPGLQLGLTQSRGHVPDRVQGEGGRGNDRSLSEV